VGIKKGPIPVGIGQDYTRIVDRCEGQTVSGSMYPGFYSLAGGCRWCRAGAACISNRSGQRPGHQDVFKVKLENKVEEQPAGARWPTALDKVLA